MVVVLLKPGELVEEFRSNKAWTVVAPREDDIRWTRADAKRFREFMIQKYQPKFVVVNSVASLVDVCEFALYFVPTVRSCMSLQRTLMETIHYMIYTFGRQQ